ncbi:MAG: MFS transporter [Lautropia sp.]
MTIASLARRMPFFYGWLIVAVAFVTMAFGVNARTAFSLLFPNIIDEFGWDRSVTAGAFSFGFLLSAFASPVLGRMMDRRGPRIVMEIGVVLIGAGMLLASLAATPWHIYATLGLMVGLGSVCLGYSCQALFLPAWFVRRRGLAVGIAFAGVGVGSIVMMPWLQFIIEHDGWRRACITLGIVVLVVLLPINLLLERRPEDIGLAPDGDGDARAAADSDAGRSAARAAQARRASIADPAWAAIDWTLARAIRTARFWWLSLALFCALFAWYAVQVHQTRYLLEIGFDAQDAAWALGVVSLVGIPGQILLGGWSDRIGREWVWSVGCGGFVLCYLALLWLGVSPGRPLLWAMVLTQGLLGYGLTPVFSAAPAEIFEGRHYGSIFGVLMVAAISGGAAGPLVAGIVHDRTGSYAPAFWLCASVACIAIGAMWMASPRKVRHVSGRVPRDAH